MRANYLTENTVPFDRSVSAYLHYPELILVIYVVQYLKICTRHTQICPCYYLLSPYWILTSPDVKCNSSDLYRIPPEVLRACMKSEILCAH